MARGIEARMRREWGFRIIAILLVVGVAAGLDLVFGAFFPPEDRSSFRVKHPYYHHGFLPSVTATAEWGGVRYPIHTNALGFRDSSPRDLPLVASRPRLLVLGDSLLEGMGVAYPDSVAGLLAQRFPETELLNAAAVSYSPKLYYLKLRYLLDELGLDLDRLVVFIDISDIQDEVVYADFVPVLPREVPGRLRSWYRRHSLVGQMLERRSARRTDMQNWFDASENADINVWFEDIEVYTRRDGVGMDTEKARWEWTLDPQVFEEWGRRGLDLARDSMRRLDALRREHGIELTVVVYPSPVQIFSNDRDSLQVRAWRSFCAQQGIPFIDLFPVFLDPTLGSPYQVYEALFIQGDIHWSTEGHRRVANALAPLLFPEKPQAE